MEETEDGEWGYLGKKWGKTERGQQRTELPVSFPHVEISAALLLSLTPQPTEQLIKGGEKSARQCLPSKTGHYSFPPSILFCRQIFPGTPSWTRTAGWGRRERRPDHCSGVRWPEHSSPQICEEPAPQDSSLFQINTLEWQQKRLSEKMNF